MRVLLTGASGFVGQHVCRALLDRGDEVVAAARGLPRTDAADAVSLDVTDRDRVIEEVRRIRPDAVVHLAGMASAAGSWERLGETLLVNVAGAGHLLEGVAEHAPEARVLLVGSGHQYDAPAEPRPLRESDRLGPTTPYGVSKVAQELLGAAWAERGLDVVMTRSFNHLGPGVDRATAAGSFCAQVAEIEAGRAEPLVRVGDLAAERDFLDVRDVARAYLALLEQGERSEVYNVASGVARRVGALLDIVLSLTEVPGIRIEASGLRPGEPTSIAGDASKLRALGWSPQIALETSVADTLAWYRARAGGRRD